MKHWWNDTDKATEVLWWKPVSVLLRRPHLTLWTFWDWTQATLVKGWNLGPCHAPNKRPGNPVRAWAGPDVCRRLRLPLFKTVATWRREGCHIRTGSLYTPREYSWCSFLLWAEFTPGP